MLPSNSENRENFRNVDCVLANHNKVQDMRANHKLITVAVCSFLSCALLAYFS